MAAAAQSPQESVDARDWEADDVEVAAFDSFNELAGTSLDAVATGLVEWFTGRDVGLDLTVAEF